MIDIPESDKVRFLYDTEAIKQLKHKYWRCNDLKLMDEMTECFTEDAVADYGPGIYLEGRETIIGFLRENIARTDVISIHQGYNPEINITSDTTATGRWPMFNYMHYRSSETVVKIWATYEDEYIKENGGWRIRKTKVDYTLTETTSSSRGLPGVTSGSDS